MEYYMPLENQDYPLITMKNERQEKIIKLELLK